MRGNERDLGINMVLFKQCPCGPARAREVAADFGQTCSGQTGARGYAPSHGHEVVFFFMKMVIQILLKLISLFPKGQADL